MALISTRGRYALRVLVDMAEQQGQEYVPLKEIARRQDISEKYLESIVKFLVRGGVLTGVRGKGGGYRLSRAPDEMRISDVLRLCEGTLSPVACLEDTAVCPQMAECRTLPLWRELNQVIEGFLSEKTIADLMRMDGGGNEYVI